MKTENRRSKWITVWLILLPLFLAAKVQGAGFDCNKAKTSVEKMICANAELSNLDEELSVVYTAALQSEKHPDAIRQGQKQWLKKRDACTDAQSLEKEYTNRIEELSSKKQGRDEDLKYIKNCIEAKDYHNAIYSAQTLSAKLMSIPGSEGINARYSLRELALDIAKNNSYPSEFRFSILRAAAFSASKELKDQSKAEVLADVAMLLRAARQSMNQKEIAGGMDTLLLAVELDQRLADNDRRFFPDSGIENLFTDFDASRIQYIDRIARLAEAIRNDNLMESFRQRLAYTAYHNLGPANLWLKKDHSWWTKDGESKEVVLERCKNLLRIVYALDTVFDCYSCGGMGWRWRPIMSIAKAYEWLGMTDEGSAYIERALKLVRNITDSNSLLSQYRFTLSEILGIHYRSKTESDRERIKNIILMLAEEMSNLANSLDTEIAKEVRGGLDKTLKDAKIK